MLLACELQTIEREIWRLRKRSISIVIQHIKWQIKTLENGKKTKNTYTEKEMTLQKGGRES